MARVITGIGIDIIELKRIDEAVKRNKKFVFRVLTENEMDLYNSYSGNRATEFLAGRFAAKEAYAKARGTGIGKIKFTDIEFLPNSLGKPEYVPGKMVDRDEQVLVSISHSKEFAVAQVLIQDISK